MTDVTSCKVHFINIDKYDKELTSKSFFPVTDLKVENDTVTFSWLISGVATKYYGTINFIIEFECVLDGEINYVWQTDIYKGFPVMESFSNSEYIFEEYYDVIEQWGQQIFAKLGKVKTVNGIEPDENGNVKIDASGLNEADRAKLDKIPTNFDVGRPANSNNAATVAMFDYEDDEVDSFTISGKGAVSVSVGTNGNEVVVGVEPEQATGNSETAVMSQNAVTKELSKVEGKIPKDMSDLNNDAGFIKSYTETDPTVPSWAKQEKKPTYTAEEIGAETKGAVDSKVSIHNNSTDAHNDIRLLLEELKASLTAFLDTDEETMNELSELITAINNNKTSIEALTVGKVNVTDIIDNLTTNVANKPLSAAQGVALKALIDELNLGKLDASALTSAINTALAQAKASGDFDGADGKTPVKGTDYFTTADKTEMVNLVIAALPTWTGGTY